MADEVASNTKAGEAAGVSGTPHFFVNGHSLDGAHPYEEFKSGAKAKTDLKGTMSSLKAGRDAFASDLRAIDGATASTWDSTRARLDKEWGDLKAVADKASSTAASSAAAHYKPGEMTCEEFVALADVEKPKIVYWAGRF